MAVWAAVLCAEAQNVQLHYDFGHLNDQLNDRPSLTTTVEMFKPDKWGSTFFFVDMDYADNKVKSAYWEIARELSFWKAPLAVHVEYNGGVGHTGSYDDAYLLGAAYNLNNADYSGGFGVQALYKYLAHKHRPHSAQFTVTWYRHFAHGALSFTGFADVWGDRSFTTEENICVFVTEPQLWLNFNKLKGVSPDFKLSVGTEWEISYNLAVQNKTLYWLPTLAAKWTF